MASRSAAMALLILVAAPSSVPAQPLLPGFEKTAQFDEQVRWSRLPSGIRVFVDAPARLKALPRLLVVYVTPNGNTLEQTLGCAASKALDWRFDIQHVAAQVRCLRAIDSKHDIFLAVVQAPRLSWPTFRGDQPADGARPGADKIICELVASLAKECAADRVVLACHSGGGSFVLGYIGAVDSIPASVERIILLDANYSYSDQQHHGERLLAWLGGDRGRRLVVVAYDDREVVLNGKKVVGPDGGTFRASQRMLARFRREVELTEQDYGPFRHISGKSGQIQFFLHLNPENKILHTALVGEMNGLLHGLTLGTDQEETWGRFGGSRAYTAWIQSAPFAEPDERRGEGEQGRRGEGEKGSVEKGASRVAPSPLLPFSLSLQLPQRPADAPPGSKFQEQIATLPLQEREAAVVREITRGNVPGFLRRLRPVQVVAFDESQTRHVGVCYVTCDYLAVGSDDDFFRVPLTPQAALAIADALDCTLLTAKISDEVQMAADLKLQPRPLTKDREAVATFFQHHRLIEGQLAGKPRGLLVAGIKKDLVWTNRLKEKPHKAAIYGWHYPDGRPIQPLYVGHRDTYVDYSHGIRLLAGQMTVDGRTLRVSDALMDNRLCGLVSNEGPIDIAELRKAAGYLATGPKRQ